MQISQPTPEQVEQDGASPVAIEPRPRRTQKRRSPRRRGSRRARRRPEGRLAQRKERHLAYARAIIVIGGVTVAALVAWLTVQALGHDDNTEADVAATLFTDPQPTMAIITAPSDASDATAIVVLTTDRATGASTMLLVPPSTMVDIPGFGLDQLSVALGYGGDELITTTLANTLGISIDWTVRMTPAAWGAWATRVEGVPITIDEVLRDRETPTVTFNPGPTVVSGEQAGQLAGLVPSNRTELQHLAMTGDLAQAFLASLAPVDAREAVIGDNAPFIEILGERGTALAYLAEVADAAASGTLVQRALPVTPAGTTDDEVYAIDETRRDILIAERFAGAAVANADGRRVQLLNGVGVPGLGQYVGQVLVEDGWRIVLTGNAATFDEPVTRILVFNASPETMQQAQELQESLGVGVIETAAATQSVADFAVVIGRDWREANSATGSAGVGL